MGRNSWFSIREAAAIGADAEIEIYGYIGGGDISARSFIDRLKEVDADRINLHINSPGGEVYDGIAIQNALRHHKAKVTVYIDGLAGSIASIVALGGDKIRIADNAYVMIHNPTALVWGEAQDMMKEAEVLLKISDGLAADYAKRMGITDDEARALMDAETWYLGQEAVDAGYADSTFGGVKAAASASFNLGRVSSKAPDEVMARFAARSQSLPPSQNGITENMPDTKPLEVHMDGNDTKTNPEAKNTETKPAEAVTVTADAGDGTETTTTTTTNASDNPVIEALIQAAIAADRQRAAGITAIGETFNFTAEARAAVAAGKSVDQFRAEILDKSADDWRAALAVKNPPENPPGDAVPTTSGDAVVAEIRKRRAARNK